LDLLAAALHCLSQGLKLSDENHRQFRPARDHVFWSPEPRLVQLLPQLFAARLTAMVLAKDWRTDHGHLLECRRTQCLWNY